MVLLFNTLNIKMRKRVKMGKIKDLIMGMEEDPAIDKNNDGSLTIPTALSIKVKKLHPDAKMPFRGSEDAAGWDITAVSMDKPEITREGMLITYRTGLAFEIPPGYFMDLRPRSSIYKTGLQLTNSCGVVDSDYRGEILFKFRDSSRGLGKIYNPGDRIGQAIIMKYEDVNYEEVEELSDTERGTGGWGSTDGKNKKQNT